MRTRIVFLILLLGAASMLLSCGASEEEHQAAQYVETFKGSLPELFDVVDEDTTSAEAPRTTVLEINPEALDERLVRFDLDGKTFYIRHRVTTEEGVWRGTLTIESVGDNVLTHVYAAFEEGLEADAAIAWDAAAHMQDIAPAGDMLVSGEHGIIYTNDATYELKRRSDGTGQFDVDRVDEFEFAPEAEPLELEDELEEAGEDIDEISLDIDAPTFVPQDDDVVFGDSQNLNDAADVSDSTTVLFVYSSAAEEERHPIADFSRLMVELHNLCLRNSRVIDRIGMAGNMVLPEIWGGEGENIVDTLIKLRQDTSVAEERDKLHADVVLGVFAATNECGVAYVGPGTGAGAYGLVRAGCALGNKTAPHELGHVFGLRHKDGYALDLLDGKPGWSSLMVKAGTCRELCTRLKYFSNPYITVDGKPGGHQDNAYSAMTLEQNFSVVSRFRVTPESPDEPVKE